MKCSRLLHEPHQKKDEGRVARWLERGLQPPAARLSVHAWLVAAPSAPDPAGAARDDRPQRVALHHRAEGLFPRSRTRGGSSAASRRTRARRIQAMRDQVSEMMRIVEAIRRWTASSASPAAARRISGFMFVVLKPKTRAHGLRRSGHPATARAAVERRGRAHVPAGGAGHPRRRPAIECAVSVHAARRFGDRSVQVVAAHHRGAAGAPRNWPTSTPTSSKAASKRW